MPPASSVQPIDVATGVEWLVDAYGCAPDRLRSIPIIATVFDGIVADLALRVVAPPAWHQFPGEAGVTGLLLLAESHLACHTFPERGFAAFNLYCCRPREEWPWAAELARRLGASEVVVERVTRGAHGAARA